MGGVGVSKSRLKQFGFRVNRELFTYKRSLTGAAPSIRSVGKHAEIAGLATTNQMLVVAKDLQTQYEKALDSASISRELRPQFRKWLRFYLDFCSKYGHSPGLG